MRPPSIERLIEPIRRAIVAYAVKTMVQRWGNSLALRIPKSFAQEIAVCEGDEVEMNITKRRLVIGPRQPTEYWLGNLVARIRRSNLHNEVSVDNPQGKEAW